MEVLQLLIRKISSALSLRGGGRRGGGGLAGEENMMDGGDLEVWGSKPTRSVRPHSCVGEVLCVPCSSDSMPMAPRGPL